jgi:hypothetical protein
METDSTAIIKDWPTPKSNNDIQILIGFKNFYRRFIQKYGKVTTPISDLFKKTVNAKWEWMREAELAFRKIKKAFTDATILQHFDPARPFILQTNASGCAIASILNDFDGFGILRQVNFYCRKCSPAEQNYDK